LMWLLIRLDQGWREIPSITTKVLNSSTLSTLSDKDRIRDYSKKCGGMLEIISVLICSIGSKNMFDKTIAVNGADRNIRPPLLRINHPVAVSLYFPRSSSINYVVVNKNDMSGLFERAPQLQR
jgi:hypothetical protein